MVDSEAFPMLFEQVYMTQLDLARAGLEWELEVRVSPDFLDRLLWENGFQTTADTAPRFRGVPLVSDPTLPPNTFRVLAERRKAEHNAAS